MRNRFDGLTVGDLAALDDTVVAVLDRFNIDCLCEADRTLEEACVTARADAAEVRAALDALPPLEPRDDPATWELPRLIDHILGTHHQYVRWALPRIADQLAALVGTADGHRPELGQVVNLMTELARNLVQHMAKEEQVLFPYIRELAHGTTTAPSPFGTVSNPIRMMEREHLEAARTMRSVRLLTDGYREDAGSEPGYRVAMRALHEFERDLCRHVHLENAILYPRAADLEGDTWQR